MSNETEIVPPPMYNYHFQPGIHNYIVVIFIGGLISVLAKTVNIPHQLPAALTGIIIGLVAKEVGQFDELVLDVHLLQDIYVPLLIAKIVYNLDHYLVMKSYLQIIIVAVLGNTLFVFAFGMVLSLFQSSAPLLNVMVMSIIVAPNDNPEIPYSDGIKNLETLMSGETILGVCVCNIARIICIGAIDNIVTEWYHVLLLIFRYLSISIPIGFACGWFMSLIFRELYNDSLNALAAYLSIAYFVYVLCEHIFYTSGTVGTFLTLYIVTLQRSRFLSKTDHDVRLCTNVGFTLMQILLTIYCISRTITSLTFARPMEFVEAIAVYTMGNVLRLIIFLLASPILSRLGYGFEFASLVTIFWAIQKGPMQMIQVFKTEQNNEDFLLSLKYYVVVYVLLTCLINGTTLKILLKAFGLIKLSNRRKANISIAINLLNSIGSKVLATLKSNPYYADVNWSVINTHTVLNNPYEDFASLWTKENVICNVCNSSVPLKPTKEEYNEHLKDVTLRALKAQRVSFLEQHEYGLITKQDVELLLQAMDIAMDSTNMKINLNALLSCMNSKNAVIVSKRVRKILTIKSNIKVPKTTHRKKIYFMTNTIIFEIIMISVVCVDLSLALTRIIHNLPTYAVYIIMTVLCLCFLCYICEATLRILGYSDNSIRKEIKFYLNNFWNRIDVLVIILSFVDIIIASTIDWESPFYNTFRWFKLVCALKILRLFSKLYPIFVAYMERRKELKLMRAFGVAQAIVISLDEVINMLPTLTEQSTIRGVIKSNLEQMRSMITQRMGLLEKTRPSLTTTVKTRQSLRCILKHLGEGIKDLRSSGLIDAFEFQKLLQTLTQKSKYLPNVRILEVIPPTLIFNEISWLAEDDELMGFVYDHVKNKIFNAGDVLCKAGDIPEGVYIIVAGYFKITYYPTPDLIANLKTNGELPTKEFLEYLRFDEVHEDFLSCGNRMAEFAALTGRPYQCSIVAEAPSQVFIIPREIVDYAKELCPDPVLGFAARIWKSILFGLGRRLLITTTSYQSVAKQEADFALTRAIVPNIEYYSVINLTPVVEDVLLLEGIIADFNSREMYTAPCPLPKHVRKLLIPKTSGNLQMTKLMFIPGSNVDEYEMMLAIQEKSELIPDHNCKILDRKNFVRKKVDSYMFNLSKPKSGYLSDSHKIPSYNGGVVFYSNDE